jgi:hypothetical protein
MSSSTETPYEVTDRFLVTDYPKIRQPVPTYLITYVAEGMAPVTVRLPKAEYSPEREKELIKADIQRRLAGTPLP